MPIYQEVRIRCLLNPNRKKVVSENTQESTTVKDKPEQRVDSSREENSEQVQSGVVIFICYRSYRNHRLENHTSPFEKWEQETEGQCSFR